MTPIPANDFAPEVSLADLLAQAADLQRQLDAVEAAQAIPAEKARSAGRSMALDSPAGIQTVSTIVEASPPAGTVDWFSTWKKHPTVSLLVTWT